MKTNFEGKELTLTQEAYYNAGSGMYEAHAIDESGKELHRWQGLSKGEKINADLYNIKRRNEEEIARICKYDGEEFIKSLLVIVDNFEY